MNGLKTDLIGEFVAIPDEGDAGWIRAVYVNAGGQLMVAVQRDNQANDLKTYLAYDIVFPEVK